MSLDPKIVETLEEVPTAMLFTVLLKKGPRNVRMRDAKRGREDGSPSDYDSSRPAKSACRC